MSDNNQGSFVAGISIGVLAGAAGYFLFGTNKGKKIREELEQEWKAAQANGVIAAHLPDKEWRFSESVMKTIQHIVKEVSDQQSRAPEAPPRARRAPAATPKKTEHRFKGVKRISMD